MTNHSRPDPTVLVIFGAAGDLTWRKLVPAIYNLYEDTWLPEHFAVIDPRLSGLRNAALLVGATRVGHVHVGRAQDGPRQVSFYQVGPAQAGHSQIGLMQADFAEVRSSQVSVPSTPLSRLGAAGPMTRCSA